MGITTRVTLRCDIPYCEQEWWADGAQVAQAIKYARSYGWTVSRYTQEWGVRCPTHKSQRYPSLGR